MTGKVVANFKLADLAGGAIGEQFEYALGEVLENIHDPNTPAEKARSIILTIKFVPTKDRSFIQVESTAKTSLQPAVAIETSLTAVKRGGRIMASENYQPELFDEVAIEGEASNV